MLRPGSGWRLRCQSWWPRCGAIGELEVDDQTVALLVAMSPATIDRRLVADRRQLELKGKAHTKPGSLLKSQDPDADVGGLG